MYKKILGIVVLVLGLSQIVLADDLVGGDDSSGALTADNSVSGSPYNPGIYIGGQFGTTNLHYSGYEYITANSSYDSKYQFAARGYLGYAFSQFISLELGYDYFGFPKFWNSTNNATQNIVQHGLDFMAKANLPLDYGFGIYVKAGLAWVYRSALHANGGLFAEKEANSKFPPIGAVGVNYWFAPNMALDLCWTKTMRVGSLPTIDLFTLGFIYKLNI